MGAGVDSLAAIFERLLTYSARQNINAMYGKMARDPRVKAALPPLPSLPDLPPMPPLASLLYPCPCPKCALERALDAADRAFAADLDGKGPAIMFIELGGKPKP